jgi:phage portal protein BeeE
VLLTTWKTYGNLQEGKKKDFLKYTQDKKPKQRFLSQNPNSTQNKRQFKYVTCIN